MVKRPNAGPALAAVLAFAVSAGTAQALTLTYEADLNPLGPTNAHGFAAVVLDKTGRSLKVNILASGLDDGGHAQHIHGPFDAAGAPADAVTPTIAADDADGDGFVELAEGFPNYGPIILGLTDAGGAFPTSVGGVLDFEATYDLSDPDIFAGDFDLDDLLPLDLREIVVHGGFAPAGVGAGTPGEVDGVAGYKPFLPVLAGDLRLVSVQGGAEVPLPAAGWMLLAGAGALVGAGARRRRRQG